MARYRPRKCRIPEKANVLAVVKIIKEFLKANNMTQKEFAVLCGWTETRLSRIMNNKNHRHGAFELSEDDLKCLAAGMRKGEIGYMELQMAAYPLYFAALGDKDTYVQMICRMSEEEEKSSSK